MATPFDFTARRPAVATVDFAPAGQGFAPAITPGQRSYLRDLMLRKAEAKGMDLIAADDRLDTWLAELTKADASRHIDGTLAWLAEHAPAASTARPIAPAATTSGVPSADVVPAGRYAIDTDDDAINATAFYRVDRPTEGRWAGRVFVKLIVSDDEQRLSWPTTKAVLAKIAAAGAAAASARYGHEIGECGVCGRTLTNDDSRARGIGPVCAEKAGW